jgi:hypothetical protein
MIGRDHSRLRGKVALVPANSAIRATTRAREGSQATHPVHTLSVLLNVLLSQYQSMRFRNWQLHAQRNPYEWFNQAAAPVALRGGSKSEGLSRGSLVRSDINDIGPKKNFQ